MSDKNEIDSDYDDSDDISLPIHPRGRDMYGINTDTQPQRPHIQLNFSADLNAETNEVLKQIQMQSEHNNSILHSNNNNNLNQEQAINELRGSVQQIVSNQQMINKSTVNSFLLHTQQQSQIQQQQRQIQQIQQIQAQQWPNANNTNNLNTDLNNLRVCHSRIEYDMDIDGKYPFLDSFAKTNGLHLRKSSKCSTNNNNNNMPQKTTTMTNNNNSKNIDCLLNLTANNVKENQFANTKTKKLANYNDNIIDYLPKKQQEPDKNGKFKCNKCHKKFGRKGTLTSHQNTVCSGKEKAFKCDYCPKRFHRKQEKTIHHRTAHTQEKPYQCGICKKRWARKQYLDRHVKKYH